MEKTFGASSFDPQAIAAKYYFGGLRVLAITRNLHSGLGAFLRWKGVTNNRRAGKPKPYQ